MADNKNDKKPSRRARALSLARAAGTAAKAAAPFALGMGGAFAGLLAMRWALQKWAPTQATPTGLMLASGLGAVVGGAAPVYLMHGRGKRANDRAQKASLPLALLGVGTVLAIGVVVPRVLAEARKRWPTLVPDLALYSPAGSAAMLAASPAKGLYARAAGMPIQDADFVELDRAAGSPWATWSRSAL